MHAHTHTCLVAKDALCEDLFDHSVGMQTSVVCVVDLQRSVIFKADYCVCEATECPSLELYLQGSARTLHA